MTRDELLDTATTVLDEARLAKTPEDRDSLTRVAQGYINVAATTL